MSKPLELIRTIKYHSVSSTTNVFFFFNTGDSWLKCVIKTVLFDRRSAEHRIYVVKYLSGSSTKIHALIYFDFFSVLYLLEHRRSGLYRETLHMDQVHQGLKWRPKGEEANMELLLNTGCIFRR